MNNILNIIIKLAKLAGILIPIWVLYELYKINLISKEYLLIVIFAGIIVFIITSLMNKLFSYIINSIIDIISNIFNK